MKDFLSFDMHNRDRRKYEVEIVFNSRLDVLFGSRLSWINSQQLQLDTQTTTTTQTDDVMGIEFFELLSLELFHIFHIFFPLCEEVEFHSTCSLHLFHTIVCTSCCSDITSMELLYLLSSHCSHHLLINQQKNHLPKKMYT